MRINTFKA